METFRALAIFSSGSCSCDGFNRVTCEYTSDGRPTSFFIWSSQRCRTRFSFLSEPTTPSFLLAYPRRSDGRRGNERLFSPHTTACLKVKSSKKEKPAHQACSSESTCIMIILNIYTPNLIPEGEAPHRSVNLDGRTLRVATHQTKKAVLFML
jgi:hypothetical protein